MGVHALPADAGLPVAVGDVVVFGDLDGYAYAWNRAFNGIPEARARFA
jgi:diaminopimelate decarboxylase